MDGSGDYLLTHIVGLVPTSGLDRPSEITAGDYVVPLERGVVTSLPMISSGMQATAITSQRYLEGLQYVYDSQLSLPALAINEDAVTSSLDLLMENPAFSQPGAKWTLSVLGEVAYSAFYRGLSTRSGVLPLEERPPGYVSPIQTYQQKRVDSMFGLTLLAQRKLYEISPDPGIS